VRLLFRVLAAWALVTLPEGVAARTWYIKADGTGDAPTIQAGVDSAVAGDVVLVGAGTYEIEAPVRLKDGITVMSESGPYETRITRAPSGNPAYGFRCTNISGAGVTEINGFWVEGFVWNPEIGSVPACGISLTACGSMRVWNNVLTGNARGVFANVNGNVDFRNNTLIGNTKGMDVQDAIIVTCWFNIIWDDNSNSCVQGYMNDLLHLSDACGPEIQMSQDPQFCGPSGGNFYLQSDSPCAPGNSPWPTVGLIGALPVACGTVKVESHTWGAIKEMYNE
jgi:hypothetical protein